MTHDDPSRGLVIGLLWAFLVLPVVPVGMAWAGAARAGAGAPGRRARLALLLLLTASLLLLLAGLAWSPVIGPDYSPRRFATAKISMVAMAATTLVAVLAKGPGRGAVVTAGVWLTLAWLYMLAVSSVV